MTSFRRAADPSGAYASNLLGACAGSLLESVSFITGIPILIAIVGLLYLAAFLCRAQSDV